MKKALIWLAVPALLLAAAIVQADPIQDNVFNKYKAGWYPNHYKQKWLLTCSRTEILVSMDLPNRKEAWR